MRKSKLLFLTASTAICTAPLYAAAQQAEGGFMLEEAPEQEEEVITTSTVELGLGWVSTNSFKFGEYTGQVNEGLFGVGNVDVHRHPPYDGNSTTYWELTGTNLGLDSRRVRAEAGMQGTFKVIGEYDQIPHYRIEDAQTPYMGSGGDTLTLPGTWTPAEDAITDNPLLPGFPGFFPANDGELHDVDIHTERQRYGGGFSWNIMEGLELSTNYRREEKDGLETIAGLFGTSGGNPSAVMLPKPIDYSTDELDVTLAYADERFQGQLSYHLSVFENNEDSLTWDNPYTSQWDPSQDFDQGGQGRMALEPDNSAHQIAVSAGYRLSPTMRIAGNFSYGWMLQDDDFLPYTVNPDLSVPIGLPRDSLDGEVKTMHGNLVFTARPTPKSDLKLAYTFDDRDNDTPRDVYLTVPNDSEDQGTADSSRARINKPYSRRAHKFEAEGGYRILPNAKVGLGYEYETVERDFTEVEDTDEHKAKINLRATPTPTVTTWLEYEFATRDGSEYVSNLPFLVSHNDDYLATIDPVADEADLYENNPFLRKFYIADRRRHLVKGSVTAMPTDQVVFGLSGSYNRSNYHNSVLGLTDMNLGNITGDVAFMPNDAITLTGFVTYEHGSYDMTGFERQGFGPGGSITPDSNLEDVQAAPGGTAEGFWTADMKDHGFTIGAGIEWEAIPDRLNFTVDYAYMNMTTEFDLDAQAFTPASLPDLESKMHSLGITGEYKFHENVSARLGYRFEHYDQEDFALDGAGLTTTHFLGFGNESPSYNAHVVWGSVVLHF